jgi:hypothetical protein
MQLDLSPIPGLFEGGNNGRGTGGKSQRLGHDDQFGQGARMHFLHHPRPMHQPLKHYQPGPVSGHVGQSNPFPLTQWLS